MPRKTFILTYMYLCSAQIMVVLLWMIILQISLKVSIPVQPKIAFSIFPPPPFLSHPQIRYNGSNVINRHYIFFCPQTRPIALSWVLSVILSITFFDTIWAPQCFTIFLLKKFFFQIWCFKILSFNFLEQCLQIKKKTFSCILQLGKLKIIEHSRNLHFKKLFKKVK